MSLQQLQEVLRQQTLALNESTDLIVSLKDQLTQSSHALTTALKPIQAVLYSGRAPIKQYVPNRLWLATSLALIAVGTAIWIL